MFEQAKDAAPRPVLSSRLQNTFNSLNEGLPEYIKFDAEELYMKIMNDMSVPYNHSLPIIRRIIGFYAAENKNFNVDEVIKAYNEYKGEINSFIREYTTMGMDDPEAEALVETVQCVADLLNIHSKQDPHIRLPGNLVKNKQAGSNAIDCERTIDLKG